MIRRYYNFVVILFCLSFITSCAVKKNQGEIAKNQYKDYAYGFITGKKPVEWNSEEGQKRLQRTKYKQSFFLLAHHFAGQVYPTTCGIASARIILSSIYEKSNEIFLKDNEHSLIEKKNGRDYDKYLLTERNIFEYYEKDGGKANYDVVARQKKNKKGHFAGGIAPVEVANIINSHPNAVAEYKELNNQDFSKDGVDNFRELVKNITISNNKYLILNYHLAAMYNRDSGHYSPVVAYDKETDSVLIMDVASHLGTWVWISLEEIYRMMNATLGGLKRGYIVVVNKSIIEQKDIKQDDIKVIEDVKDNDTETEEEVEEKETIITKKNVKSKQNQEILTENEEQEEETNEKDNIVEKNNKQEQLKIVKKSKQENVQKNDKQGSNNKNEITPTQQNRKKIRRKVIKRTKTYKINNNASTNVY